MRDENTLYWIWLAERCGVASRDFGRLVEKYDNPFDLYRLEEEEIEHLEGLGAGLKARLCDKSLDSAYSIMRYCKANKVDIISYGDKRYPERLKRIETPPVVLYCLGHFPSFDERLCVGMVGTRKMSEYGKQSAYRISYELASAKAVIVSGMALGVDGVCACGALAAGGETVAVLGCGISVVYPKEHEKLMGEIASHGAVITEYPPMERPNAQNFPKRNRLISGLCQGVVIIEGAVGSGALITASRAIAQGRDVFALPGKINESNSEGPNELIKNGANIALSSEDILNFYDFLYHDAIYYRGHSRSKKKHIDVEESLERFGVSDVYYRGRFAPKPLKDSTEERKTAASSGRSEKRSGAERAVSLSSETDCEKTESNADHSAELLASLDENTKKIFENMPIDKAVSADALSDTGMSVPIIMSAFTMLEVYGLVESLPGGLYIRK